MATEEQELSAHDEVVKSLTPYIEKHTLKLLLTGDKAWEATDLVPHPQDEEVKDRYPHLLEQAQGIPDSLRVVLVGDAITEDGVPAYMAWLNRIRPLRDVSGADDHPFALWIRGWTAEENVHSTAFDRYLTHYQHASIDSKAVERTTRNLIANGFDPAIGQDPYNAFIYVSIQEEATQISHTNVGNAARQAGDEVLFRLSRRIGSDEARHKEAYVGVMGQIFELDPDGATIAFRKMVSKGITMPAARMTDSGSLRSGQRTSDLFEDYADVAQDSGIYTPHHYGGVVGGLIQRWGVMDRSLYTDQGKRAQEQLQSWAAPDLGDRLTAMLARKQANRPDTLQFSWIKGRSVKVNRPG